MSDDIKQKKEELLIKLLQENPQLSMKDANVSIREAFDTGVAPPVFSRLKKDLFSGQTEVAPEKPAPVEEEKPKAKPKAEKKAPAETKVPVEKKASAKPKAKKVPKVAEEDLDLFDGSEARKALAAEEERKAKEAKLEPLLGEDEDKPNKKPRPKKKTHKNKDSEHGETVSEADSETASSESKEEVKKEEPKKEEEPEIDPNLPKHVVKLEVKIPKASEVHLAGSFNRWRTSELALQKAEGSQWTFEGELPEGTYEYKFVVDQKVWFLDMDLARVTDKTGVSHRIVIPQTA